VEIDRFKRLVRSSGILLNAVLLRLTFCNG